jgi:hypothetical protein
MLRYCAGCRGTLFYFAGLRGTRFVFILFVHKITQERLIQLLSVLEEASEDPFVQFLVRVVVIVIIMLKFCADIFVNLSCSSSVHQLSRHRRSLQNGFK